MIQSLRHSQANLLERLQILSKVRKSLFEPFTAEVHDKLSAVVLIVKRIILLQIEDVRDMCLKKRF